MARGIEHVRTLNGEISAYEQRDAYTFETEALPRTAAGTEYRCHAVEQERLPDHWALLAGEAIQNLRSALDHLVYEKGGEHERAQFPICDTAAAFVQSGLGRIEGVPVAIRERIEAAQPYVRTPDAPELDALSILRDLSNRDKHRVLATVVSAVTREGVGVGEGVVLDWKMMATERRLGSGRTHISTFVANADDPARETEVEPMFAYKVLIAGLSPSHLSFVARESWRTLVECEAGKPLHPLAPFPDV